MKKVLTVIILVVALQLAVVSATYAAPPASGGGGYYHHVVYGETLYSIGRAYNANPHCLAEYNGLWNPDVIYAGEVLYIPTACTGYPWYAHKPVHYPGYGHDGYGHDGYGHGKKGVGYYHCNVNCNYGGYYPQKPVHYGYDYTGYYYGHGKKRYSHTCGYYNNCW